MEPPAPDADPLPAPECLRCEVRLRYVGEKSFREGTNWGVIGEIGHLFEKRSSFDVYVCPQCGHVDFFVGHAARNDPYREARRRGAASGPCRRCRRRRYFFTFGG